MRDITVSRTKTRHALAIASCVIALGFGALASAAAAQAHGIGPASANLATSSAPVSAASAAASSPVAGSALRARHAPEVRAMDYQGCSAGFFCTAEYEVSAPGTWQYTLENYILYGGVHFLPYGECSPNEEPGCGMGLISFANNTGYRVWLEQYQDGGNEYCISNHTYSYDFTGNVNYLDYWIYFS